MKRATRMAIRRPVTAKATINALNAEAWRLRNTETSKALALAQESESLATRSGYKKGRAWSLCAQGHCYLRLSDYAAAETASRAALALFISLGDVRGEALAVSTLGAIYTITGNHLQAIEHYQKSIALCDRASDVKIKASVLNSMGSAYMFLSDYTRAVESYTTAFDLATQIGDEQGQAAILANQSSVYTLIGDYDKALKKALESATRCKSLGDRYAQANALSNAGTIYETINALDSALRCHQESLSLNEEVGNKLSVAVCHINIGTVQEKLGDTDGALNSYQKSLALRMALGDRRGVALSHYSIGVLCIALGLEQEAASHLQQCLQEASDIGDVQTQIDGRIRLGNLMQNVSPDKPFALLQEALVLAENIGAKSQQYEAHEALAAAYTRSGDFEKALKHYTAFHRIKESVFNAESDTRIRNLQVAHDALRLRKEAEIQKVSNEKLTLSLDHKTRELTALALQLAEKNQLLVDLKKTLSVLNPSVNPHAKPTAEPHGELHSEPHRAQGAAESALKRIERNIRAEADWKRFDELFNQLNQNFLNALALRCPNLSPTELKIATLLKLGLASKQIAGLLSVSTRTVENHRLNIRKKLNLNSKTNVVSFLTTL